MGSWNLQAHPSDIPALTKSHFSILLKQFYWTFKPIRLWGAFPFKSTLSKSLHWANLINILIFKCIISTDPGWCVSVPSIFTRVILWKLMVHVNHGMFTLELKAGVGLGVWESVRWSSRLKGLVCKPDNLSATPCIHMVLHTDTMVSFCYQEISQKMRDQD